VVIDRIAVVVGTSIIKDSDIDRDVRVTTFLNREALDFSGPARKKAANRLIERIFIRREIRVGGYATVPASEASAQIDALRKERFPSKAAFDEALRKYGLIEATLRIELQWQLTVLRFIDARFRPAVMVSEDEIKKYNAAHPAKAPLEERRGAISDAIAGEKVNQLFFAWLEEQRKDNKIRFREDSLA
jgi:hypothetical protein